MKVLEITYKIKKKKKNSCKQPIDKSSTFHAFTGCRFLGFMANEKCQR